MKQIERESAQWGDGPLRQEMRARWHCQPFPRAQAAPLRKLARWEGLHGCPSPGQHGLFRPGVERGRLGAGGPSP